MHPILFETRWLLREVDRNSYTIFIETNKTKYLIAEVRSSREKLRSCYDPALFVWKIKNATDQHTTDR